MGITSLLSLGQSGLFASQASLQTVGNNIANVNTEGYRRRTVRLEESMSLNYAPGQIGTGVTAAEVQRSFDKFIESTYNDKASLRERWGTLYEELRALDSLFSEANQDGVNKALSQFFAAWNDLAATPDSYPAREALLAQTQTIVSLLNSADAQMQALQQQADNYIQQDVTRVNEIVKSIAEINRQINEQDVPGVNNANELYDRRDLLVRELAEKMDIRYIDNGGGNITVLTQAGQTLVDRDVAYEIRFENPRSFTDLVPNSTFDGQVYFSGSDDFEYTFQVVQGGGVTSGAGAAMMKVSLDGGKTWMKNEDGTDYLVSARPEDGKITVGNVKIWFGTASDPASAPTTGMAVGDTFTVVPKKGLYWYQNTSTCENITPQISLSGQDNTRRLVGGTLTGYFNFRDDYIGDYRDKLDSFAQALIWETNRIHSQGAGLAHHGGITGTYAVDSDVVALGSDASGLAYGNRLAAGSAKLYVYDATTGALVSNASLDFSAAPGLQGFDPSQHTLEDVRDAINRSFGGSLTASIVNHRLQITANSGYTFEMGEDTTGLWAALGVNTFFDGSDARSLSFNSGIQQNLAHINAGHVNGAGEANTGDNTSALAMTHLSSKKVSITSVHSGTVSTTLSSFYNSLVAEVGGDTERASFNFIYQKALADDLDRRQQEVSGVNLDEEMSDMIKFQHSYTAAAKLITTADQMMQTLLGLKQ